MRTLLATLKQFSSSRLCRSSTVLCMTFAGLYGGPAFAESRSYAIEWFSLASYSQDGDCPGGVNPPTREQYYKSLALLGKSPGEVNRLMQEYEKGGRDAAEVMHILNMRGRMNGKPVNAFVYPWTVADPNLRSVVGKYALGFNLDGKNGPKDFEDPLTHETGIDHQLFRALGCIEQFRGTYTYRPTFWDFIWGSMKVTTPAWLFTLTGQNLEGDGPITITFDRALEHLTFGPSGEAIADATYRIDPDLRSHHVFEGEIKGGKISITKPGDLVLLLDTLSFVQFRLRETHLRLNLKPNGNLEGLIGGYQPWGDIYASFAEGGQAYEGMILNDIPGIYYLLKKNADAEPDPRTGENLAISAAYHIEAVPIIAVTPKGSEYKRASIERGEHEEGVRQ